MIDDGIKMPDVEEYSKEQLLAFEKEVLGIYISGHPLEEYEKSINRNVTAFSSEFILDEEINSPKVGDGIKHLIGGMITEITIKSTRNNKTMAFLTLEDMLGTVEIIVFPREFDKYKNLIVTDSKVYIRGRATIEEEKDAKLICQEIIPFEHVSQELWLRYKDYESFKEDEQSLYNLLSEYPGTESVIIYCDKEKAVKRLARSKNVKIDQELINRIESVYNKDCIRVVDGKI